MSNGVAQGSDTNKMSNYSLTEMAIEFLRLLHHVLIHKNLCCLEAFFGIQLITELFGMQIMLLTINNWNMEGETVT